MKDILIKTDLFDIISIRDLKIDRSVCKHSELFISCVISIDSATLIKNSINNTIDFTIKNQKELEKKIFCGIIHQLNIKTENESCILDMYCYSTSINSDLKKHIRTYQYTDMTYRDLFDDLERDSKNINILLPQHRDTKIKSLIVQYNETDWEFSNRIASRLGTIVIPNDTSDTSFFSVGLINRSQENNIDIISSEISINHTLNKKINVSGNRISDQSSLDTIITTRNYLNLADKVVFNGMPLIVYSSVSKYIGDEIVHTYTLRDKNGFVIPKYHNDEIIGNSLKGKVVEVKHNLIRIKIYDDIPQREFLWFTYATPFSQPNGPGWYFMPEIGDEVRLQFPDEEEKNAYTSSSVHITHGDRTNHKIKYIRTIYGQELRFTPDFVKLTDNHGSSITLDHEQGISVVSDKNIKMQADKNITLTAQGKITATAAENITLKNNQSVISIDENIDIVSAHSRIQ